MTNPMKERYSAAAKPALQEQFKYANVMALPRIEKICINVGLGEYVQNSKSLELANADLTSIVGQKPLVTRAKKSIANFRLREGMPNGLKVTLRGARMWDFLQKLITLALPRIRD